MYTYIIEIRFGVYTHICEWTFATTYMYRNLQQFYTICSKCGWLSLLLRKHTLWVFVRCFHMSPEHVSFCSLYNATSYTNLVFWGQNEHGTCINMHPALSRLSLINTDTVLYLIHVCHALVRNCSGLYKAWDWFLHVAYRAALVCLYMWETGFENTSFELVLHLVLSHAQCNICYSLL